MDNPLISICVPTFNGEQYITDALKSAINQTYKKIEIIVSDDASVDCTLDIVKDFKNRTTIPIHLFNHLPNGIGANWNNCITHSSGDYIKFLFQDDVLKPNCIEKMLEVLQNDETIGLVACQRTFLYEQEYMTKELAKWIETFGNLQKDLKLINRGNYQVLDKSFFGSKQFLKSPMNKIGEPTAVLFKKSIIEEIGYFREDLKQILDYEFYYRVLSNAEIAILPETLVYFRLHPKQTSVYNSENYDEDEDDFSKILYQDYMGFLDNYTKIHLRKKYCWFYKFYYYLKSYSNGK
ncbi:glycosyltransferase [Winogradskyella maritima]|uniref:Glycosyltransferase family 2 protein n=1 Tax=Winogradskyella maritima TaxID=1517766 RepID=A0ABV8AKW6_9FLAO|nr:glycosyltransferase [Winogradskyella maritima]